MPHCTDSPHPPAAPPPPPSPSSSSPLSPLTPPRLPLQIPFDATVRVSLDTNLVMIKENPDDGPSCTLAGRWYRDPSLPINRSEITRFPHAVLEVKLSLAEGEHSPAWVQVGQRAGQLLKGLWGFGMRMLVCVLAWVGAGGQRTGQQWAAQCTVRCQVGMLDCSPRTMACSAACAPLWREVALHMSCSTAAMTNALWMYRTTRWCCATSCPQCEHLLHSSRKHVAQALSLCLPSLLVPGAARLWLPDRGAQVQQVHPRLLHAVP